MINMDNYNTNVKKMERYLESYSKRNITRNGTPLVISFLITNRCNLRCKHCFYHETIDNTNKQMELTIDEYEKLSKSMGNFLTGIFAGGEPFIRDDFYEIVNIFHRNNNMMLADSASNGQLTDSIISQVEKILKYSPNQSYSLGISLDGPRDIHNVIRGNGTFEKAIETWNELKKLKNRYKNFELYICTTMNTINEYHMEEFINYAIKELQPDKISLIKTRQQPRVGEFIKNINLNNYLKCINVIEKHRENLDNDVLEKPQSYLLSSINNYIYDGEICEKKLFKCYAGLHGGFVDYNGDVSPCEIMPKVGNLRDYNMNFDELWNTNISNQRRKEVNCNKLCSTCTHESEGLLPSLYFAPNDIKYERKWENNKFVI